MAKAGVKPTPTAFRLVSGQRNTTRHGTEAELLAKVEATADHFGKLKKPGYLKGDAAKAWRMFIAPAMWLDASRIGACIRLCQLWQESQMNPLGFQSSKEAQMRGYFADLGLTDERNRGEVKVKAPDPYFED